MEGVVCRIKRPKHELAGSRPEGRGRTGSICENMMWQDQAGKTSAGRIKKLSRRIKRPKAVLAKTSLLQTNRGSARLARGRRAASGSRQFRIQRCCPIQMVRSTYLIMHSALLCCCCALHPTAAANVAQLLQVLRHIHQPNRCQRWDFWRPRTSWIDQIEPAGLLGHCGNGRIGRAVPPLLASLQRLSSSEGCYSARPE